MRVEGDGAGWVNHVRVGWWYWRLCRFWYYPWLWGVRSPCSWDVPLAYDNPVWIWGHWWDGGQVLPEESVMQGVGWGCSVVSGWISCKHVRCSVLLSQLAQEFEATQCCLVGDEINEGGISWCFLVSLGILMKTLIQVDSDGRTFTNNWMLSGTKGKLRYNLLLTGSKVFSFLLRIFFGHIYY